MRSTAALRVLLRCGAPYSLLATAALNLVPRPLRDTGYKMVAAVRYRVFGEDDGSSCRRMTKAMRARFFRMRSRKGRVIPSSPKRMAALALPVSNTKTTNTPRKLSPIRESRGPMSGESPASSSN